MKNKEIPLGYMSIASFDGKLFGDYYYEFDDKFDDKEDFEERQEEIKECNPKEVILEANKEYKLKIDYPVRIPYEAKIKTGQNGLNRQQTCKLIVKHYHKMYQEEDSSTQEKPGHIPGMFNRNETNGKYGIWGHDIGDLILHTLYIKDNELTLGVDS